MAANALSCGLDVSKGNHGGGITRRTEGAYTETPTDPHNALATPISR